MYGQNFGLRFLRHLVARYSVDFVSYDAKGNLLKSKLMPEDPIIRGTLWLGIWPLLPVLP